MTAVATDLAEFLLARIAEDEESAGYEQIPVRNYRDGEWRTIPGKLKPGDKRLLAECDAKRRIIALHARTDFGAGRFGCAICDAYEADEGSWGSGDAGPCDTLCALALPYADHPGYLDAWRPENSLT